MSMKIWNGVRFKATVPEEVVAQLHSVRKRALTNSKTYITAGKGAALAVRAAGYDKDSVFGIDTDDYKQMFDFRDRLENSFNKRFRSWEDPAFRFSVVVIPWQGALYGISYHEEIEDNRRLLDDFIEEYYYQDQTDKPDDVSDEEWQTRSGVWNDIFDRYVSPSEAGLTYEIVRSDDLTIDDVKDIITNYRAQFADGWTIRCEPKTHDATDPLWDRFRQTDFRKITETVSGVFVYDEWQRDLSDFVYVKLAVAGETEKDALETLLREEYSDILTFTTVFEKVRCDWLFSEKKKEAGE